MAFTTNVYQNGRWVTQEVTFDQLLQPRDAQRADRKPVPIAPQYGVLTTTIVESPLVHTILPVRLRSAKHVDVAFIGDHFLQIYELRTTSHAPHNLSCRYHVEDIARKIDFGSRIRGAKVIGAMYDGPDLKNEEEIPIKSETEAGLETFGTDDFIMSGGTQSSNLASQSSRMPPQLLALVLENGSCIFLCMRNNEAGEWHFEMSTFTGPETRLWTPGFHFAVDPSSRYMALGCHQDIFIVCELETREKLERRFAQGEPLNPVRTVRPRTVNGLIHKMEFLYPNPQDDYHIILLLITIKDGRSRSATYDWEVDDNLKDVLSQEKKGNSLPREHQMPLLIIPLAVCSAFFVISQDSIAVCKNILEGPPSFEVFHLQEQEPTEFHHGSTHPLWAAWTRPLRTRDQLEAGQDHIYLAREDGRLIFLEIESENILNATASLGLLNGNIATALGSVPGPFADVLLMGGDSGPGAMYELLPRKYPRPLILMPNWSPAVDFTTTDNFSNQVQEGMETGDSAGRWKDPQAITIPIPDRIFSASGRGLKGSVTEFRTGIQGKIDVHLEVGEPVKMMWMLPNMVADETNGLHVLITMPGHSMLLLAPEDLADDVAMVDESASPYDISSQTLAAAEVEQDNIIQVTEKSLVIVTRSGHKKYRLVELLDLPETPEMTVLDAVIHKNFVALSTHVESAFQLRIIGFGPDMTPVPSGIRDVEGEVTCLACIDWLEQPYLVAGIWNDDEPALRLLSAHDAGEAFSAKYRLASPDLIEAINTQHQSAYRRFDGRVNAVVCLPNHDKITIVAGSRSGEVVTLGFAKNFDGSCKLLTSHYDKIGSRNVQLCLLDETPPNAFSSAAKLSVLACCDRKAVKMARLCPKTNHLRDIHHVLPIDLEDETRTTVDLRSANMVRQSLLPRTGGTNVLFASGTEVLLVELQQMSQAVPRVLPLGATPTKLIYVSKLDCLVVSLKTGDKLSLKFLDPVTGADLSKPGRERREDEQIDAGNYEDSQHISGLGRSGDAILDLSQWDFKKPDGKKDVATWTYILVSLKSGKLLVLSTKRLPAEVGQSRGKISFWTRLKKRCQAPVQCALGSNDDIFFCAGTTLYWEKLDPVAKGLVAVDTFQLRSPATTIRLINGRLVVLTAADSVQVIELSGAVQSSPPAGAGPTTTGQSLLTSLRHSAPVTHDGAVHMIELAPDMSLSNISDEYKDEEEGTSQERRKGKGKDSQAATSPMDKTIILLSDRACGAAGLWVPWKQPGKNCISVMNSRLPASIRKFARVRSRPSWDIVRTRDNVQYGEIPTRADGAEILGLCLDGSVLHFSLLDVRAWAILRHVALLWLGQEDKERRHDDEGLIAFAEDGLGYDEPLSDAEKLSDRHVDGDVLKRALQRRGLKEILKRWPVEAGRMNMLLTALLGEEWMDDVKGEEVEEEVEMEGARDPVERQEKMLDGMVDLVYDILEYHLAPVM